MGNESDRKVHVLRWKVDDKTYQRFQQIVKDGRFTTGYELCQYIFSVFMCIADPTTEMTAGLEELKDVWHDWQKPDSRFNCINGTKSLKMVSAMYAFANKAGQPVAFELVSERGGKKTVTHSSKDIFERMSSDMFPVLSRKLRKVGREIDEASMVRVIDYLCEEYTPEGRGDYAMNEYGIVPKRNRDGNGQG